MSEKNLLQVASMDKYNYFINGKGSFYMQVKYGSGVLNEVCEERFKEFFPTGILIELPFNKGIKIQLFYDGVIVNDGLPKPYTWLVVEKLTNIIEHVKKMEESHMRIEYEIFGIA